MLLLSVKLELHDRSATYLLSPYTLTLSRSLTPLLSHSYLLPKFPSFVFNHLRTQVGRGRGRGIKTALSRDFPLSRITEDGPRTVEPLSLLESILTKCAPISPLESILTKNNRGGGIAWPDFPSNHDSLSSNLQSATPWPSLLGELYAHHPQPHSHPY